MLELQELYQQLIIDHGRHPRNFSELACANHSKEGYNPVCGDRLTVYLLEEAGLLKDIRFTGSGCAISMASASLMTEVLKGKPVDEAKILFEHFHALLTEKKEAPENMANRPTDSSSTSVSDHIPQEVKVSVFFRS